MSKPHAVIASMLLGVIATPASANHALYTYGNPNTMQFCEVMQIDLSPMPWHRETLSHTRIADKHILIPVSSSVILIHGSM